MAMYIKESIDWVRRDDLESDSIESIWLDVFVKNSKSFLLATCYRPPDGSNYLPPDLTQLVAMRPEIGKWVSGNAPSCALD